MSIYGSGASAVSAIRSRCVDYASAAGLSTGLNATPFRKDLNLNFFNGAAISRTSFSDDPYQNERYSHETSSSASISDDGHYVSVEMALSVLGYGNKNTEENYQNAKYGYSIESPYVSEASASDIFYQIIAGLRCSDVIPRDLQKKSESKSFSKYGGKISHTISYSNKLWDTDENGNYVIDYNGSSKSLYKQNYQLVNLCGQTKKVYFPVEPIYSQTTTYKTTVGGNAIIATEYVPFPLSEFSNLRDYVIDQSCSVSVSKKSKTLSSEITELI
jgi:hypothetical protein